jgi:hypothetical protein
MLEKVLPSPSNAWWLKPPVGLRDFLRGLMCGATWAGFESGPSRPFVIVDILGPAPRMVGSIFLLLLYRVGVA